MSKYKSWNQMQDEEEDFKGWIVAILVMILASIFLYHSCNKIEHLQKELRKYEKVKI